ncbi:MAG: NAD(P)/FAD-dependent oxidoreductase [Limibacillus sp.]
MTSSETTDVVIIGGGHNGLTCAGYLARGGLKVKIVERRPVVGGAACTEEFHPGFRNSVYSYVVSLLSPKVIKDLELERHGLEVMDRHCGSFNALPDGQHLYMSRDPKEIQAEIAKFSKKDAELFPEFEHLLEKLSLAVRAMINEAPPNLGGGLPELWTALKTGNRLRHLSDKEQAALAELMTMSIGDFLNRWFESDPIKGDFGFEGVIGNFVGPYAQGSAYVLLHHSIGQAHGRDGAWGHARGGMGSIAKALERSCAAYNVEIETDAPVREVLTEKGRAVGVVLEDGRTIRAKAVASNLNPKLLFSGMVDETLLPADFKRRIGGWRNRSGSFRMNVALSEMPRFTSLEGAQKPQAYLSGTINICPSLDYIQAAYDDARTTGWAKRPIVSMCIPSTLDDSLAPEGQHVASLFCQHFNPELPGGRSWDEVKEEVADLIIDRVNEVAPNFKQAVVGRQVKSPLDLERDLGLLGGDIFHGALHLDQIYSLRPAAGYADYRMPLPGLYLCGSGAHPGGGVSGLPGHHAAAAILKDARRGGLAA